jgi:hypothetical protein
MSERFGKYTIVYETHEVLMNTYKKDKKAWIN